MSKAASGLDATVEAGERTTSARPGRKAAAVRARIRQAAAFVVGRDGYPAASIAKITEAAGISNGLFYYYFQNREQLLDELLPELGKEMVACIVAEVDHLPFGLEREMAGFAAYLRFIEANQSFVRVFTEAQVYVPDAYQAHMRWILDNFVVGLRRQMRHGGLDVAEHDLLALAYTLTGIRNFATQMLYQSTDGRDATRESMLRVYRKALDGLFGPDGTRTTTNNGRTSSWAPPPHLPCGTTLPSDS